MLSLEIEKKICVLLIKIRIKDQIVMQSIDKNTFSHYSFREPEISTTNFIHYHFNNFALF